MKAAEKAETASIIKRQHRTRSSSRGGFLKKKFSPSPASVSPLIATRVLASHFGDAIQLSPLDPPDFAFHIVFGHAHCFTGDREGAIHYARRAADHPNAHPFGLAATAWIFELCGERASARASLDRLYRPAPVTWPRSCTSARNTPNVTAAISNAPSTGWVSAKRPQQRL